MRKRANGEGSIYRRKNGKWVAVITLGTGKRKFKKLWVLLKQGGKRSQRNAPALYVGSGDRDRTVHHHLMMVRGCVRQPAAAGFLGRLRVDSYIKVWLSLYDYRTDSYESLRGSSSLLSISTSGNVLKCPFRVWSIRRIGERANNRVLCAELFQEEGPGENGDAGEMKGPIR